MKVFISADIEGVTAITAPEEANPAHPDTAWYRDQMTREVKAACEGAIAAGATDILVKDAHWTGRNIDPRGLPEMARMVRGWTGHPFSMMAELTSQFDAVLLIGYHARAGSGGNPLAHTFSSQTVAGLRVNGRPASEFLFSTYTATMLGVPVTFVSGDAALGDEVRAYNEAIHTVATFTGIGTGTVSIHPDVALRQIRAGVTESLSVEKKSKIRPLPDRFKVEIDYRSVREAYGASFYPGARLEGEGTVTFECRDWMDALRMKHFCI